MATKYFGRPNSEVFYDTSLMIISFLFAEIFSVTHCLINSFPGFNAFLSQTGHFQHKIMQMFEKSVQVKISCREMVRFHQLRGSQSVSKFFCYAIYLKSLEKKKA